MNLAGLEAAKEGRARARTTPPHQVGESLGLCWGNFEAKSLEWKRQGGRGWLERP